MVLTSHIIIVHGIVADADYGLPVLLHQLQRKTIDYYCLNT